MVASQEQLSSMDLDIWPTSQAEPTFFEGWRFFFFLFRIAVRETMQSISAFEPQRINKALNQSMKAYLELRHFRCYYLLTDYVLHAIYHCLILPYSSVPYHRTEQFNFTTVE
jgi:hypothetical protein